MPRTRIRVALGVAAVALIAIAIALVVGLTARSGAGGARGHFNTAFNKVSGDPDALAGKKSEDLAGNGGEPDAGGALSFAEQDYQNRAYPADEIPLQATLDAQTAWAQVSSRSGGRGQTGAWQLIGPSKSTYPSVLSRTGAQYVTSGRITALAISSNCSASYCRLYVGAAGGGIWSTDKALSGSPKWTFTSGSFATNAIGSLLIDPSDPSGNIVYAGTGEPNASGDSEAGMGIYKSTDGGQNWSLVTGSSAFRGRAISSLALDKDGKLLAGVARAVRGVSSVTGGATSIPPAPVAAFGVYRQTGATFTQIWNAPGSVRGVNEVRVDPTNPSVLYAAAFQDGIYRSLNNGATWTQIFSALVPARNDDRTEFAVNTKAGKTIVYVGEGAKFGLSAFYRIDDAAGAAVVSGPNAQTINYCTGQCWYDNGVTSPAGSPDTVYLVGSFNYGQLGGKSNARAVLLSTDGGATFSDLTVDSSPHNPDSIHPDQHVLVVNPNDPLQFLEGSDGGLVRNEGGFVDASSDCDSRGLNAADTAYCKSLLWRIPKSIVSLNEGLSTLQFQSLSIDPKRPLNNLQGGTQDNGTFQYTGSSDVWWQEIYGDGGQSGFNSADDQLRFNTFFGEQGDVNFRDGQPTKWVVATGPIVASPEGSNFYIPIIPDPNPAMAGSIFAGAQSVWRTQDWAGNRDYLEANCPEFTTFSDNPACGDFVTIGPAGATDLTSAAYGADRLGAAVAAVERAPGDTGTLWAATNTGRVFVSKNADAAASLVVWHRIDTSASNDPGRFVSSIYVNATNPYQAWVSYSGYNFNTPAQPGHVFRVDYNPITNTATWTNLDGLTGPMGDLPVTDLVRDDATGTLYASTDFGVMKYDGTAWTVAAPGMPMVETPGLSINAGARVLYAATHGRGAWQLNLG